MGFKENLVVELALSEEMADKLPSGFQRIGDCIIVDLSKFDSLWKKKIGEGVLKLFPYIRTVCSKEGGISGTFREPSVLFVAGDQNTEVVHIENGIKYSFDSTKIMFAKGNVVERVRIPKQVVDGEIIVDMFAGIGYFSLAIGKLARPKKIYAIELNPVSFNFLQKNITLNKINSIEAINGDNRTIIDELVSEGVKADRVIMGYLPPPKEFLPWAFRILKKGGVLHYEDLVTLTSERAEVKRIVEEVNAIAHEYGRSVSLVFDRKIKSYGPKIGHWVFDLVVE